VNPDDVMRPAPVDTLDREADAFALPLSIG
jgi:hypothetical protein